MNPVASGNLQSPDAGSLVDFLSAETHEVAEGVTVPPSSSSDTSPKENAVPEKTDLWQQILQEQLPHTCHPSAQMFQTLCSGLPICLAHAF